MKKEKYIYERTSKSGRKYLEVQVNYKNENNEWKTINGGMFYYDQYSSPKEAMKAAVASRDLLRKKTKLEPKLKHELTLDELYQLRTKYFSIAKGTAKKHDAVYYHGLESIRNTRISSISAGILQSLINKYAENHSHDSTARLKSVLRMIYKTAILEGFVVPMLPDVLIVPKEKIVIEKRQIETSEEEFKLFLKELLDYNYVDQKADYINQCIWYSLQLQFYLGLRPQEAYALCAEDIDLKKNAISINKRIGSNATEYRQFVPLKTDESEAILPIPNGLFPIVKELLGWSKTRPLLANTDGLPFDSTHISNRIHTISKICEKKYGFSFNQYRLRHLFARNLFRSGASPKVIQSLMRHASIDMSVYYDWVTMEEKQNVINTLKTKHSVTENSQKKSLHNSTNKVRSS